MCRQQNTGTFLLQTFNSLPFTFPLLILPLRIFCNIEMAKKGKIGHEGVISKITAQTVEVTISSQSACAGCHAHSVCSAADAKEKKITAQHPGFDISIGEKVMVMASKGNAAYSVVLAYLVPVILILAAIFLLQNAGIDETWAAVGAIIVVAFYYLFLYFFRNNISQKIKFTVEKLNV